MESNFKKHILIILSLIISINTFPENLSNDVIRSWKVDLYGNADSTTIDTLWTNFQKMNPLYKNNISSTYLGGIGTASISNNFFNRHTNENVFIPFFHDYISLSNDLSYYNTKKPFSQINYTASNGARTKLEQTLNIFHTQNINPETNVGFKYYAISDRGNYKSVWSQESNRTDFQRKRTRINSFALFSSHNGENYNAYANLVFNKIGPNEEIGGIDRDSSLYYLHQADTVERTEDISTQLIGATSEIKNQSFLFKHEWKLGNFQRTVDTNVISVKQPILGVMHELEYNRSTRIYSDRGGKDFYNQFFIDSLSSFDSTYYRSIRNALKIKLYENPDWFFRFGGYSGIELDFKRFSYNSPTDTIVIEKDNSMNDIDNIHITWENNDTIFDNIKDTSFIESTFNGFGFLKLKDNLQVDLSYDLTLSGYRAGDLNISSGLTTILPIRSIDFITEIRVGRLSKTPSYFYQSYSSNHHSWQNNFTREKKEWLSISMALDTTIFKLDANYARIKNYLFFDRSVQPKQHNVPVNILSAQLNYNFRIWKVYSRNKILYQTTDAKDTVLSLPKISYCNTTYFQFNVVKNVLAAQLGFELYYNTKFYSSAFDPSSGQFYNQYEKQLGDYPYINLFVNAKWKRARIFALLEHANAGLKFTNFDYFSALHYPRNGRWLKLGISWTFYD